MSPGRERVSHTAEPRGGVQPEARGPYQGAELQGSYSATIRTFPLRSAPSGGYLTPHAVTADIFRDGGQGSRWLQSQPSWQPPQRQHEHDVDGRRTSTRAAGVRRE
jgi:hypothetical protein